MSLFQARTYWAAKPDSEEECGPGCLCVGNVDNAEDGAAKIVTGSFQGFIRVYAPKGRDYSVGDLLLEMNLEEPILSLAVGQFVPSSQRLALAVLHPRRVSVYSVKAGGGGYFQLQKMYDHRLPRTACSMVTGRFGYNSQGDFICVQSMDGQLAFFEQNSFGFARFLGDFLVPGPLCYHPRSDLFVTCSSSHEVKAFAYQQIAAASQATRRDKTYDQKDQTDSSKPDSPQKSGTGKLKTAWSVNIGERAVAIKVGQLTNSEQVLVLGTRTLFVINPSNGEITSQKRLEYSPSALCTYPVQQPGLNASKDHFMVGSLQKSLLVYNAQRLIWSAVVNFVPVDLQVCEFFGVKGFVVGLSDDCEVQLLVMGTDPPPHSIVPADNMKEVNYASLDQEYKQLSRTIKQVSAGGLERKESRGPLFLEAAMQPNLETIDEPTLELIKSRLMARQGAKLDTSPTPSKDNSNGDFSTALRQSENPSSISSAFAYDVRDTVQAHDRGYVCAWLSLHISSPNKVRLANNLVTVSVEMSPAFQLPATYFAVYFQGLGGYLHVPVRISANILPDTLDGRVVCSYVNQTGEARTAVAGFSVPYVVCCRATTPIRECAFRFTLHCSHQTPSLVKLFPELLQPAIRSQLNLAKNAARVMSVVYYGSDLDATVITSSTTNRFGVQSSRFEGLSLLARELIRRVKAFYPGEKVSVQFKDALPLKDYFTVIDKHFATRHRIAEVSMGLAKTSHQFRAIQKRLLTRLKDRHPTSLARLNVLLQETYHQLIELCTQLNTLSSQETQLGAAVAQCTQLLHCLLIAQCDLDARHQRLLKLYFPAQVTGVGGLTPAQRATKSSTSVHQGWEERVSASLLFLLKTKLPAQKGGRPSAGGGIHVHYQIEALKDAMKLKRHIQILCDRLRKGCRVPVDSVE